MSLAVYLPEHALPGLRSFPRLLDSLGIQISEVMHLDSCVLKINSYHKFFKKNKTKLKQTRRTSREA